MPFMLLLIGAVIVVSAIRNTQGDLGNALTTDMPGFFKWALAITAVGGIGWVPGMKPISRMLLALVLVVLVLNNYVNLFKGFTVLVQTPPAGTTAATAPAQAYAANPSAPIPSGDVTGTSTATNVNSFAGPATTSPFGAFDPAAYLTAYEKGVGGFGGVV